MLGGMKRMHHVSISTPDIERLISFYQNAFGFEIYETFSWDKGTTVFDHLIGIKGSAAKTVLLKCDESYIELFEFSSPSLKWAESDRLVCDYGLTHFAFEVEDVQAAYEELLELGMRFNGPPIKLGTKGMVVYGYDPDGNVVELLGP